MKVAYVVPRYGTEFHGGAEYAARMLAERLVAQRGWEVEVLTTCAVDTQTWADRVPAGTTVEGGVTVHRFHVDSGRHHRFDAISRRVLSAPTRASMADQVRWIEMQGPRSDALLGAVADTDADLVAFYPYLFHPTFHGVPRVGPRRSVFHPAAHDEPPLRLPAFGRVFAGVGGFVFQTESERAMVEERFGIGATPQLVLGLGVEEGPGRPEDALARLGLDDRPYLVYVNRIDHGKGTGALVDFFAAYKSARPGPLRLVLAGDVVHAPEPHDDVVLVGRVDEETKWGLLRGAMAMVNPSAFEAFSLLTIEAWTAGVPVVVNGRCGPTREHCVRSGGGLWYESFAEFVAVLDHLAGDPGLRAALGAAGHDYVRANFEWPALIDRYAAFLEHLAERSRRPLSRRSVVV
ncbi:MAG: glycosyltransferase family 4 protein [Acidimicrobiia bacterium]